MLLGLFLSTPSSLPLVPPQTLCPRQGLPLSTLLRQMFSPLDPGESLYLFFLVETETSTQRHPGYHETRFQATGSFQVGPCIA